MTDVQRVTSGALLDAFAARSQAERVPGLSLSRLGGCRREVGYLLAEHPPSDPSSGNRQAALGQAIHKVLAEEARALGLTAEEEVTLFGIPGHFDRYEPDTATVVDTKTVYNRVAKVKRQGPLQQERWQPHLYGTALVLAGKPVRLVRIEYLDRATGEEYVFEEPLNVALAREAMEWLRQVRESPLEMLPRDYLPDSEKCKGCPFRTDCWGGGVEGRAVASVLFVENPDARGWAEMYEVARAEAGDADKRRKFAKGALDALRPDGDARVLTVVADGVTFTYRWKNGRRTPDMDEVEKFYREHDGGPVPMKQGDGWWEISTDLDLTYDE